MKYTTKNILRELAKQLGLNVKFVHYFANNTHGKLLPREKRILINANKPRYEHVYTLLHEVGHQLLHFKKIKPRRLSPWYLNLNWRIDAIANIASKVRRAIRFTFNKERGKEWEADVWAMCWFVCLTKFVGRSDLTAFLKRHPEKRAIYMLATTAVFYSATKKRIARAFKLLGMARHALSAQLF